MIINYAHRGASGYFPENTMIAFSKAIELGATGIETDVQMTSDGQLVLIHDESLLRTTGVNKLVNELSLAEIQRLDAGSWYNESFASEIIPTLDQLMQLAKANSIKLNLEIKSGLVMYPNIEQRIIEKIYDYDLQNDVIISSFNHYALAQCKFIDPNIATGILYMEGLYLPWEYAALLQANALHAPPYAVNSQLVQEARKHGIIYNVFTVNKEHEMKALMQAEVAGIITDYPDRLNYILHGGD